MANKKKKATPKSSKSNGDMYSKNYAPNISQRGVSFLFWGVTAIVFLAIGLVLGQMMV